MDGRKKYSNEFKLGAISLVVDHGINSFASKWSRLLSSYQPSECGIQLFPDSKLIRLHRRPVFHEFLKDPRDCDIINSVIGKDVEC